jgi:hypothetical protein
MLKYAALLFNTIALLIYQFFFADGITVTQNVPSSAKAEDEFTVELVINKGTISGFAKLQQDLPEGFTAVAQDNNGGSFTFSNQSVKFIWMSLPTEKEFKVRYKVKVAAGVSGDKVIAGKFSYVSDNVKQAVEISPATITIGSGSTQPVATNTNTTTSTPDPVVTENKTTEPVLTNNTATEPVATSTTTTTSSEVSSVTAIRSVPGTAGSEFRVDITVNKGTVTGFAKLLETLPAGFTATAIESAGGSFSFADQKVKYVWVSMPTQPEFKIAYKVTVAPSVSGFQTIDGIFSYIENDETKKHSLATSSINIGGSTPLATNTPTNTNNTNTTTPEVKTTEPVNTTTEPVVTNNTNSNTNSNSGNSSQNNSAATLSATNVPAPQQGNVAYRVQVMALRKAVDANVIATRYNINQKIDTEMAEGLTKYTVGAHNDYKSARDAREDIRSKGVTGPFVTAYNSGRRITVQEALMISNQKWFR